MATKKQAKTTPAYCLDCGKQLTWFTYADAYEGGKWVGRVCFDCKQARVQKTNPKRHRLPGRDSKGRFVKRCKSNPPRPRTYVPRCRICQRRLTGKEAHPGYCSTCRVKGRVYQDISPLAPKRTTRMSP